MDEAFDALAMNGHVHIIGAVSGNWSANVPYFKMIRGSVRMHGINVGSRAMFEDLIAFVAKHNLKPVVEEASCFAMADTQKAFEHMVAQRHFGKVAIDIAQ